MQYQNGTIIYIGLAGIAAERERWAAELAALAGANEPGRIDPRRALTQLARALPQDAMVATDIGNVCSVANSYLRFEQLCLFFFPCVNRSSHSLKYRSFSFR